MDLSDCFALQILAMVMFLLMMLMMVIIVMIIMNVLMVVWCDGDLLMVKAKNVSERVTAEQPRLADDCRREHIHIKTQNTTMK